MLAFMFSEILKKTEHVLEIPNLQAEATPFQPRHFRSHDWKDSDAFTQNKYLFFCTSIHNFVQIWIEIFCSTIHYLFKKRYFTLK